MEELENRVKRGGTFETKTKIWRIHAEDLTFNY